MAGGAKSALRRLALAAACLVTGLGLPGESRAGAMDELQQLPPHVREYVIKAAFIYNFARFTEWPEQAFGTSATPIRLCLLGGNPFGRAIDSLAGKKIGEREVAVSQVLWAEQAADCHLLFISEAAAGHMPEILPLVEGKPVLTIGDTPDVVGAGAIIGLQIVDKKIRFRVNLDNVERSGLKLSSRLLNLAAIVRNDVGEVGSNPSQAQAGGRGQ